MESVAALSGRSGYPGLKVVGRGGKAFGGGPSVSLPAKGADGQRGSRRDPVRPEARPRLAESALDIRCRSPADARQDIGGSAGSLRAAAAAGAAALLPDGSALRHRLAGIGIGGAAAFGGAAGCPHDLGWGQGRQRTAGAAERGFKAGDGRLPRGDRGAKVRKEEKCQRLEMAVSLVRRERPSDTPTFCP